MSEQKTYGGGCPMHANSGDMEFAANTGSNLTYNSYLKVPELLNLQVQQSKPAHHDELLFIVIHQAYELWFKLILHEMENAIRYMKEQNTLRAYHFMNRAVQILKLLVQQIHILETMAPVEFLAFRDHLMPASGFQSAQFREIEFLAGLKDEAFMKVFKSQPEFFARLEKRLREPDIRSAYYDMLRAQGFKIPENAGDLERSGCSDKVREEIARGLVPIYQNTVDHLPLHLLSESLVEFDEYLGLWREHHVKVVERVIGAKRGTGGSEGVNYLKSTTSKKCFPALWEVRTYLVKEIRA
ncbi:MAG: tryptophan 2,3-dioxygenase family protein [Bdellovibrionia bacterium]